MHVWDKREDTLEIRIILSQLAKACDPLGIISPTMAEGKHISVQEKKRKEKKRKEKKRKEKKRKEKKRRDGIPRFRQN